jgi:acetylornithine/succinyldiaminopimelate/putrescine aminotransferase
MLAEVLTTIAPGGLTRAFFTASGSEAVEGALLLATLASGRPGIVSFEGGLHGRTRWAMNATGIPMWRTDPFPLEGMHSCPFGDIDALERTLCTHGGKIAAVIGEPIQGNGGVNVPPDDFWPRVRELCDRHGALLVLDEIQTGFNRTGRWFACEHWGVKPDILAISKALGNGFPIAAFMAREDIARRYTKPGASTYGGNPVASVAALATIAHHKAANLGQAARQRGAELRAGLERLHAAFPTTTRAPRGMGLMQAMPIVDVHGAPDPTGCDRVLEGLKDAGILAGKTGTDRNVVTFLPPLTISSQEILHVVESLESVL